MTKIGEQLLQPEDGMRRIHPGAETMVVPDAYFNGISVRLHERGGAAKFNFTGTRLRILTNGGYNLGLTVCIDGGPVEPLQHNCDTAMSLSLDKSGLTDKEHTCVLAVTYNSNNNSIDFVGIDIDEAGSILKYDPMPGKTKISILQMKVGDRIPFHYKATANAFGTIDQLGTSNASEIPVSSTATPDGTAYFIHTGYDLRGRMKLVADRNIQHSISWDTLNTAGVASGSGLPMKIDSKDKYTIRLLSGGISVADKDNEWDKIIAESTLNGTITAGDNDIWNWSGMCSWASNNISSGGALVRGNSSAISWNQTPTSNALVSNGFRPVLLVEPQNNFYLILKNNVAYSYSNNSLVEVSSNWSGLTNVQKQGLFTSREFPTVAVLNGLGQFSVLTFSESNTAAKVVVSAVPFKTTLATGYTPKITGSAKPQFVYAREDVDLSGSEHIDWIHMNHDITNSVTGNSKLKYIFSIDKGVTWKTYKGGTFVDILNTTDAADGALVDERFVPSTAAMARLLAEGLDKAVFDATPWHEITIGVNNKLIRFASVFDLDKATDQCFNDNLAYQYDSLSVWKQAVNGLDYEVRYNSPSKLEVKFLTGGYKAKVNY